MSGTRIMGVITRRPVGGVLILCLAATAMACGKTFRAESSVVAESLTPPRKCLVRVGASVAHKSAEIEFADGRMNKPAGAGDGIAEVFQYEPVAALSPAGRDRTPPAHVVWIGGPAAEAEPDIRAVADDGRNDTFVVYRRSPTLAMMKAARRCLDVFGGV